MSPDRRNPIVVTGASSGIGRATARRLADEGHPIALVGRDDSRLVETQSLLSGSGHRRYEADLAEPAVEPGLLTSVVRDMGQIRGLVHCAGISSVRPIRSTRRADVEGLFDVNVSSAVMLAQAFCAPGLRTPKSSMVFVSSILASVGMPGAAAYSASKGAILSLSRSLAVELAGGGIRVNSVCPGLVDTPMTTDLRRRIGDTAFDSLAEAYPLGVGSADDVASSIAFLISDDASWITGSALVVDGGYSAR